MQFFSFLILYLSSVKEEGTGASTGWRTKEVAQTSHVRIKPRQAAVRYGAVLFLSVGRGLPELPIGSGAGGTCHLLRPRIVILRCMHHTSFFCYVLSPCSLASTQDRRKFPKPDQAGASKAWGRKQTPGNEACSHHIIIMQSPCLNWPHHTFPGGNDKFVLARNMVLTPELVQVVRWVGDTGLPAYICRFTGKMAAKGQMVTIMNGLLQF